MPVIHQLELGTVVLPAQHPRAAEGQSVILGYAIEHPDGIVLVDTGVGVGHPLIDELYEPAVVDIVAALHSNGMDERDVGAIVNSHLHFDHCGQNHRFPTTPVWVTQVEHDLSTSEFYTVPEWAAIDLDRLRLASDGEEPAPGVRLLHSPGHTPGHQSIAVQTDHGLEVIVGQACFDCGEFDVGVPAPSDMHGADWVEVGRASLGRLRDLEPSRAYFSHDLTIHHR